MRRKTSLVLVALASLSWLAASCTDGDADADSEHHHVHTATADSRPQVTFRAGNDRLEIPAEIPSGYVDIHVEALPGGSAHFLFQQLPDGMSFDELDALPEAEVETALAPQFGNGGVADGDGIVITAYLEPGNWEVANIWFDESGEPNFTPGRFVVVDRGNDAPAPEAHGTIVIGPGMHVEVPDGFDATGTWKVENHDEAELHEAALIALTGDATTEDLVTAFTEESEPPLLGEFGGMGALGPGNEAWVTFPADAFEPGHYALVCWIPDVNGIPHLFSGMFHDVTLG